MRHVSALRAVKFSRGYWWLRIVGIAGLRIVRNAVDEK